MRYNKDVEQHRFYIDGASYRTEKATLSGRELKTLAGVALAYDLLLRGEGDFPGRVISDHEIVNLRQEPEFTTYARSR